MRNKMNILSIILTGVMICALSLGTTDMKVMASNEEVCVDSSYITSEDYSEGVIEALPWGTYLKSGNSTVANAGNGKVSAGGATVGQKVVSEIKVAVRLQKLVNGNWQAYRFWSAANTNSAYVSLTKTVSVDRGYYYRVYSTHTAGGETSSSSTNGIYIK